MSSGDDWWRGTSEPGRFVNRRWRRSRPGDLHPRRRAEDRAAEQPPEPDPIADLFDPGSLFRDPEPTAPSHDSRVVEPWASLGLTSDATWSAVVARHRELAKQHHPDRAGTDEVAVRDAAARMATINAAFAELGKIYRLSGDR